MTNKKTILGFSLAAAFTISLIGTAYAAPSWLGYSDPLVKEGDNNTKLFATADGDVPRRTSDFASFAWLYAAGGPHSAVAITTHSADISKPNPFNYEDNNARNDFRDSTQNPDGWHAHNLVLTDGAGTSSTFCVADLSDAPEMGIALKKNGAIQVVADNSDLTGDVIPYGGAFIIQVDDDCDPTIGTEGYLGGGGPAPLGVLAVEAVLPP